MTFSDMHSLSIISTTFGGWGSIWRALSIDQKLKKSPREWSKITHLKNQEKIKKIQRHSAPLNPKKWSFYVVNWKVLENYSVSQITKTINFRRSKNQLFQKFEAFWVPKNEPKWWLFDNMKKLIFHCKNNGLGTFEGSRNHLKSDAKILEKQ